MRRHYYELFMKNSKVGLLADCVFYCFQNEAITDKEALSLDLFLRRLYSLMNFDSENLVDIPDFCKREFNNN